MSLLKRKTAVLLICLISSFLVAAQEKYISQFQVSPFNDRMFYKSFNNIYTLNKGRVGFAGKVGNTNWHHVSLYDSCRQPVFSKVFKHDRALFNPNPTMLGNAGVYMVKDYNKTSGFKLARFTWSGKKVFSKAFHFKKNYCHEYYSYTITSNNGIFLVALGGQGSDCFRPINKRFLLTLLIDKNGNLVKQEALRISDQLYPDISNIMHDPNGGYLIGLDDQIISLNDSGKLKKAVKFKYTSTGDFNYLKGKSKNYFYIFSDLSGVNNRKILKIDYSDFSIKWARSIPYNGISEGIVTRSGKIIWVGNLSPLHATNDSSGLGLTTFNEKGKHLHSLQYPGYLFKNSSRFLQKSKEAPDSGFLIPAINTNNSKSHLIKTDNRGKTECSGKYFTPNIDTPRKPVKTLLNYKRVKRQVKAKQGSFTLFPSKVKERMVCSKKLYPKAHLGADTIICRDSSLTLSPGIDTSAFQYKWNTGSTSPAITVSSTGQYSVSVSYKGCVARDSIHVTFLYDNPADLGPDTTICEGDSVNLNVPSNGDQWLWQPPEVDTIANADTIGQLDTYVADNGIYRLFLDSVKQCPLDTMALQYYQKPDVELGSSKPICPYDSVLLVVDSNKGNFKWQTPGSSADWVSGSKTWASDTGQYLLLDSTLECTIDEFRLSHYRLPEAKAGPDTTVCYDQEYTMQGEGGANYRWTPAKYLSSDTIPDPVANLPEKQEYALIVKNKAGCSDTSKVILDVHPPLDVNLKANDTALCGNQLLKLRAEAKGGKPVKYRFNWTPQVGNGKKIKTQIRNSRHFKVRLSDGCSEPTTDSLFVRAKAVPKADFTMQPRDTVYYNNTVEFQNQSLNAKDYYWDFGPFNAATDKVSPSYRYRDTGTYRVKLLASGANGCTDTATGKIHVKDDYKAYIPNAFSPDGNGINDEWAINGRGIAGYEFQIYNRWGARIYSTNGGKDRPSWDGTYQGSKKPVQSGFYLFKLKVEDKASRVHHYHGELKVIR